MVGRVRPRGWAPAPAVRLLRVLGQVLARARRGVLDGHLLREMWGDVGRYGEIWGDMGRDRER